VRLAYGRTALSPVVVRVAGLALYRDVPCEASTAVSLHGHALRRLSITRLGICAEFLMQKGQLLIELAPCLRQFVESGPPLGIGTMMARCLL
jgi:hypothetical protein